MKRFIHLLFGFCLLLPLLASAANDPERRRQDVESKIAKVVKEINAEKNRYSDLEQKLAAIEKDIQTQARAIKKLDEKIAVGQQRRRQLESKKSAQSEAMQQQQALLGKQLRAAWMAGNQERLQLWLNGGDVSMFGPTMTWHDYINKSRVNNVVDLSHELELLAQTERELIEASEVLQQLSRRERENATRLKASREQRAALMASSRGRILADEGELNSLKAEQKQLTDLITRLKAAAAEAKRVKPEIPATPFAKLQGKLHWPVKGKVLHDYGEPRADGRLKWNGVTIAANRGSKVRSVAAGEVIFADWLGRLGLLMIVDHGDNYLALYGHNQALYKKPGDKVTAGELIASVGDSGGRTESALYFEVRKGSGFRNPHLWLKKAAL